MVACVLKLGGRGGHWSTLLLTRAVMVFVGRARWELG
jgi:hypothetical protein